MLLLTDKDREDMQGLILSGYGHLPNAMFLFLQIHDEARAKEWLRKVAPSVTTAAPWPIGPDGHKIKPTWALNIGLTYTGVQRLGLTEQTLASFAREFILGMPERATILGDHGTSAPETWELGYTDDQRRIDVLLMLYADTPEHLDELETTQLRYLEESAGGVAELPGPSAPVPGTLSADSEPRERGRRARPAGSRSRQAGQRMVRSTADMAARLQTLTLGEAVPGVAAHAVALAMAQRAEQARGIPAMVLGEAEPDVLAQAAAAASAAEEASAAPVRNAAQARHELKPDLQDVKGYKAGPDRVPVNGLPREQFGFPDGISQPLVEGTMPDYATGQPVIRTGEFIMGYLNAYNVYPNSPSVTTRDDPQNILPIFPEDAAPGCHDLGHNGTYLVYRKLEEHVADFWEFIQRNAQLGVQGDDPDQKRLKYLMNWLAAKCLGRWTSGAPLSMAPEYDNPILGADNHRNNNFLYKPEDEAGWNCPIGAHIRRTNPRDALVFDTSDDSFKSVSRHRIIRRSIHFGEPLVTDEMVTDGNAPIDLKDDGKQRGIHFFAINTDISRQFEFTQQTWANQPTFNGLYDNKDPIIGDNDPPSSMVIQRDPLRLTIPNVPRVVTVRGGAYFFMPSITALRYLGDGA
jgi:Dyp-type peroxidase family